jgi:hypothetical protein
LSVVVFDITIGLNNSDSLVIRIIIPEIGLVSPIPYILNTANHYIDFLLLAKRIRRKKERKQDDRSN